MHKIYMTKGGLAMAPTGELFDNVQVDEFGAVYTQDGVQLIYVPDSLSEYTVKKGTAIIGDCAFEGCVELTSVCLPDGVTHIGSNAFSGCCNLSSVSLPDSVVCVGEGAFSYCSSLSSVRLSNKLTDLADGVFFGCSSLSSIKNGSCWDGSNVPFLFIPNGVQRIGAGTFCGCSSLGLCIFLPNSLTCIGNNAFRGCSSLAVVNIPASVRNMGCGVFNGCFSLDEIRCKNSRFKIVDDILYTNDGVVLSCWNQKPEIVLTSDTKKVICAAFSDCSHLVSIQIPDGVIEVEIDEYWSLSDYCDSLKQIVIPKGSKPKFELLFGYDDQDKLVEK